MSYFTHIVLANLAFISHMDEGEFPPGYLKNTKKKDIVDDVIYPSSMSFLHSYFLVTSSP